MAITNQMIISQAQAELYEQGKIKATGRILRFVDQATGELVELPELEEIHTYAAWKSIGYQVRRGETAVAKIGIWKYAAKKKKDDAPSSLTVNPGDGEGEPGGHCFMKTAAFFSASQVERIEKKTA